MKMQMKSTVTMVILIGMTCGCGTFELATRSNPDDPHGYAAIQFWSPFGQSPESKEMKFVTEHGFASSGVRSPAAASTR